MNSNKWLKIVIGSIVTLAGVALLFWPFITASWMLAIVFGTALISSGIASLTQFYASVAAKIFGIALILLGILAAIFNEFTASVLVTVVGASIITLSLLWLAIGISMRAGASPLTIGPAVLGIIIGLIPLMWPQFALSIIAVFFGLLLAFWGISIITKAAKPDDRIQTFRL